MRIQCGYSEEEEEGRRGKMFKEKEQNWIKKNVLWRRNIFKEKCMVGGGRGGGRRKGGRGPPPLIKRGTVMVEWGNSEEEAEEEEDALLLLSCNEVQ